MSLLVQSLWSAQACHNLSSLCLCFERSLLQHWRIEVNSVFRSSFWLPNTFWTSKNTTRNKNLSVQVGRNPFFCSHLLCLIWRFSCTIRSHKDWHTHHIITLTSNRGYVHEFNLLAFLATTFSNDWEIMNVWISISAIKSDFPRFNFPGFTAVLSAWSFTSSEFNPGPGRTFCNWMSIPASENFLLTCRHCKTKICEMYNK